MNYPSETMQWRQELHDKLFHPDIYNLPPIGRLRHLTLHMAKYQGKYLAHQMVGAEREMRAVVIDALIVLQSMANVLGHTIQGDSQYAKDVGFSHKALDALVIRTGHLCKYLEAWDHMESVDYRGEITRAIEDLVYSWTYLRCNRLVKESEVYKRLEQLEKKSPFYSQLCQKHPELDFNWVT